jgi:hypothetical protein
MRIARALVGILKRPMKEVLKIRDVQQPGLQKGFIL